jgi:hypothetical protein
MSGSENYPFPPSPVPNSFWLPWPQWWGSSRHQGVSRVEIWMPWVWYFETPLALLLVLDTLHACWMGCVLWLAYLRDVWLIGICNFHNIKRAQQVNKTCAGCMGLSIGWLTRETAARKALCQCRTFMHWIDTRVQDYKKNALNTESTNCTINICVIFQCKVSSTGYHLGKVCALLMERITHFDLWPNDNLPVSGFRGLSRHAQAYVMSRFGLRLPKGIRHNLAHQGASTLWFHL